MMSSQEPFNDWDRLSMGYTASLLISDGLCVAGGAWPSAVDLRQHTVTGYVMGHSNVLAVVPSRDFALIQLANHGARWFPESGGFALSEVLDVPPLEPDYPGDDHDPSVSRSRSAPGSATASAREPRRSRLADAVAAGEQAAVRGRGAPCARAEALAAGLDAEDAIGGEGGVGAPQREDPFAGRQVELASDGLRR